MGKLHLKQHLDEKDSTHHTKIYIREELDQIVIEHILEKRLIEGESITKSSWYRDLAIERLKEEGKLPKDYVYNKKHG